MTAHLLDANVLIALTQDDHVHHERARGWVASTDTFALCPITEGAFVRYRTRGGHSIESSREFIARLHDSHRCTFWPDDLSYTDVDVRHVLGHRQVTDAYLAGLARHHGARLATFDRALATAAPVVAELIP